MKYSLHCHGTQAMAYISAIQDTEGTLQETVALRHDILTVDPGTDQELQGGVVMRMAVSIGCGARDLVSGDLRQSYGS